MLRGSPIKWADQLHGESEGAAKVNYCSMMATMQAQLARGSKCLMDVGRPSVH